MGLGWVLLADKILQDVKSLGTLNDGNYGMRRTMDNPGFCPSAVCWLRVDGCGGSLQDSRDFQISGSLGASSSCRGLSVLGAIPIVSIVVPFPFFGLNLFYIKDPKR